MLNYVIHLHVDLMLNAIMESVLVCPIIMKIRLLVVDQNVYLTMIALETKLA